MSYDERRAASELERQNGALRADDETQPLLPMASQHDATPADEPPTSPVVPTTAKTTAGHAVREIVETLLLALIIFLAVRLVVLNFRVDGYSMMPNLHNGEMLLVNRNAYFHFDENALLNWLPGEDRHGQHIVYLFHPPRRGDIIVFNPPVPNATKPYIKRVIGLAGDRISFQGGYVYVNGQQLTEPYIKGPITECSSPTQYCDLTVPKGDIFVLGDNRENSSDSRYFGPVNINRIIGKAWVTYWPLGDAGLVPHYSYPAADGH